MTKISIGSVIKTSIVAAFTFTAALMWREVFVDTVSLFFPEDALLYKFIAAIIITIFVIIAIYIILKTEQEAGGFFKNLKRKIK